MIVVTLVSLWQNIKRVKIAICFLSKRVADAKIDLLSFSFSNVVVLCRNQKSRFLLKGSIWLLLLAHVSTKRLLILHKNLDK